MVCPDRIGSGFQRRDKLRRCLSLLEIGGYLTDSAGRIVGIEKRTLDLSEVFFLAELIC